ncbi:MAG: hypothetical protein IJR24_05895 [Alloprevotella sp.]|nr:hypothetical protein [Alloprevotella sp.]
MKKLQFLLAAAAITFAGCSSDSYLGDEEFALSQETTGASAFGGNAGRMVRATSNTGTVAEMLDHHFKVYGVKETATAGTFTDVFQNYAVWDNTTKTTSNPDGDAADADNKSRMNGWEYVGDGSAKGGLGTQTIKYWDYSAPNYHFVAGSPASAFTFDGAATGITTATVTGLAGHLNPNTGTGITTNPIYIADPVNVAKTNYNQEVLLSFKRQQTFVRVGFFETIPGYSVTEIKFYPYDQANSKWGTPATDNITLASTAADYFMGSNNGKATITYTWAPTPSYTFVNDGTTMTKQNNWYGGKLGTGITMGTTSTAPSWGTDSDMNTTSKYFTVIPSPSALTAQPLLIKCDYVLTADDGKGETIKVSGATAAIPAAFCKWNPNTSYTYLFKISDNTNGTTGTPGTDLEGLFPITFDAAVIAEIDGTQQGTITTVSTPSITTYQEGSVTAEGIKYKKNTPIYFTVQNDETGALKTLTALSNYGTPVEGNIQVYVTDPGKTEADMALVRPVDGNKFTTTIGAAAQAINGQEVPSGNWASFTPTVARTYVIEYTGDGGVHTYKIVKVEE